MLTHGLQDGGHLFTLPLGPDVGTDPLLQELETPLILGDTQQLHGALLIGSKTSHFPDKITNKFVVSGQLALGFTGPLLHLVKGGLVAFIETSANFVLGRHPERRPTIDQDLRNNESLLAKWCIFNLRVLLLSR